MSHSCRRLRASPRDKNSHSDAHREPNNDEPSSNEPSNDEPSNDEPSKWRGGDVAGWVLRLWKSRFLM